MSLLMIVLVIVLVAVFVGSLQWRPWGTGYYSYGPSLAIFVLLVLLVLYILGVL